MQAWIGRPGSTARPRFGPGPDAGPGWPPNEPATLLASRSKYRVGQHADARVNPRVARFAVFLRQPGHAPRLVGVGERDLLAVGQFRGLACLDAVDVPLFRCADRADVEPLPRVLGRSGMCHPPAPSAGRHAPAPISPQQMASAHDSHRRSAPSGLRSCAFIFILSVGLPPRPTRHLRACHGCARRGGDSGGMWSNDDRHRACCGRLRR